MVIVLEVSLFINKIIFITKLCVTNKIISNKSHSMIKNSENAGLRKRLENFSYCPTHNIGRGYSSQVYRGKNDLTGNFFNNPR